MTVVATLVGAVLIVAALRDIFQQLFRRSGGGSLSRLLMHAFWRVFHRVAGRRRVLLEFAGSSVLIGIISGWVLLLTIVWALILWPRLPEEFIFATGLNPWNQDGFVDALYLSLVTLVTLGYGDITPASGWLRLLLPLEGLIGFVLLTAAISWVLSIYPVLSRRRSFAREAYLIRDAERHTGVPSEQSSAQTAERTLRDLASQLVVVRGDLVQFPSTYFSHEDETQSSLPAAMPYLDHLAARTSGPECPPRVRLRGAMLRAAVDDLSSTVASKYLRVPPSASTGEILEAFARDHFFAPHKGSGPGTGS